MSSEQLTRPNNQINKNTKLFLIDLLVIVFLYFLPHFIWRSGEFNPIPVRNFLFNSQIILPLIILVVSVVFVHFCLNRLLMMVDMNSKNNKLKFLIFLLLALAVLIFQFINVGSSSPSLMGDGMIGPLFGIFFVMLQLLLVVVTFSISTIILIGRNFNWPRNPLIYLLELPALVVAYYCILVIFSKIVIFFYPIQ